MTASNKRLSKTVVAGLRAIRSPNKTVALMSIKIRFLDSGFENRSIILVMEGRRIGDEGATKQWHDNFNVFFFFKYHQ